MCNTYNFECFIEIYHSPNNAMQDSVKICKEKQCFFFSFIKFEKFLLEVFVF